METVYEWLLHNVGNEGNYLTILNVQRQASEAGLSGIGVLARTKDFKVLNLLVRPVETSLKPVPHAINSATTPDTYFFETDQATIAYLTTGKLPNADAAKTGIEVIVQAPMGDAEATVFPPER